MWRWFSRHFANLLLWGISGSLPLAAILLDEDFDKESLPVASGWHFLSLPVTLVRERDALAGWESLDSKKEVSLPAPLTDFDSTESEPLRQSFRIQVYGTVDKGTVSVYCFFDTSNNRWFRLPVGGVDPEAGIALFAGDKDEQPVVMDVSSGDCYRMEPGEHELLRDECAQRKGFREFK